MHKNVLPTSVALKIAREIGYKQGEAIDLGNIGNVYLEKNDPDTALEYYQNALKIAREIGYKEGEAATLRNMAIAYRKNGRLTQSRISYQKKHSLI